MSHSSKTITIKCIGVTPMNVTLPAFNLKYNVRCPKCDSIVYKGQKCCGKRVLG